MRALLATLLVIVGGLGVLEVIPGTEAVVVSVWTVYLAVLAAWWGLSLGLNASLHFSGCSCCATGMDRIYLTCVSPMQAPADEMLHELDRLRSRRCPGPAYCRHEVRRQ